MARTNKKGELFSHLSSMQVCNDGGGGTGNTTLTAAPAAGATAITVAAITNLVDGDYIRVGSGEEMEICKVSGAPSGNTVNLRSPLEFAHAIGDAVIEQTLTNLGHITNNGFKLKLNGDDVAVQSATRRLVLAYILGHNEIVGSVELENFNAQNLARAQGRPESDVTGSGTAASPERTTINPAKFRSENDLAFIAYGARKDGKTVEVQLWGVELDVTALDLALSRGAVAPIPMSFRCTSGASIELYT